MGQQGSSLHGQQGSSLHAAAPPAQARKGKSRKARRMLTEEWLERLMDRMEKEYTHALQVRGPGPGRGRGAAGWLRVLRGPKP